MSFLNSINLLVIFLAFCSAAAFYGHSVDPEHPGKCVDKIYAGFILAPGEEVNDPKLCLHIKCHKGFEIESYSCGVYAPPDGCVLGDAITAPYPKCCNRSFICNTVT